MRVTDRLHDRCVGEQLLVVGEYGDASQRPDGRGDVLDRRPRQTRGVLQREQPRTVVRFHRDGVLDRAARVGREPSPANPRQRAPFEPVEARQDRPAPVALRRRRWPTDEIDAEGHRVGQRQLADRPRRHAVGQTSARCRVGGSAPQRARESRKQDEQERGQRNALQEHARRRKQRRPPGDSRRGRFAQRSECAAEHKHHRQCHDCRADRLTVEELRQRDEKRKACEQAAVTRASRFDELDADQRVQERHAGIAGEKIAEAHPDADPDHQREQRQEPRRQRAVGGQQQPGDDQARPECGDPGGQVRPQRQLRDKDERSEPEELRAREWRGRGGREDHGALSRGKSASAVSAARR